MRLEALGRRLCVASGVALMYADDLDDLLAGEPDQERESKLDAERVTLEFATWSRRRLDAGRRSIEDSPLFGGERQGQLW